ncbi:MAG TPA: hypothetical protein VFW04_15675 [Gemmatimonadaceae bacterium]|nr:hypothetical protein [Gemmatimonadaceae bacterium]
MSTYGRQPWKVRGSNWARIAAASSRRYSCIGSARFPLGLLTRYSSTLVIGSLSALTPQRMIRRTAATRSRTWFGTWPNCASAFRYSSSSAGVTSVAILLRPANVSNFRQRCRYPTAVVCARTSSATASQYASQSSRSVIGGNVGVDGCVSRS